MPKGKRTEEDEFEDVELSPGFEDEARRAGIDPYDGEDEDEDDDDLDLEDDEDEDEDDDGEDLEDDEDDEDEDDADDEDDEDDDPEDQRRAKKKRSARDRIKELAKARRESDRRALELEIQLAEAQKAGGNTSTPAEAPTEPDPKDFKYGEVDSDYIDAMVDYRVAVRQAEEQQQQEQARQQETEQEANRRYQTRLSEVMETGEKKYPGFKKAINDTIFDADLARRVLDSDNAVDLALHLSKNMDDLRDLTRAGPEERLRKLGILEGKLSATSAAKKRKSTAPKTPEKGRRKKRTSRAAGKYGPADQDEFDKAFYRQ